MDRAFWMKLVAFCLVTVAMMPGLAWADPAFSANVLQIQGGRMTNPNAFRQRTFLTTDSIDFEATYYDPLVACDGVAPTFVQLFVFNLEGLFIGLFDGTSSGFGPGFTKLRTIERSLSAGALPAGSYQFTFLVRTCNNAASVILPEFVTFRVITP